MTWSLLRFIARCFAAGFFVLGITWFLIVTYLLIFGGGPDGITLGPGVL